MAVVHYWRTGMYPSPSHRPLLGSIRLINKPYIWTSLSAYCTYISNLHIYNLYIPDQNLSLPYQTIYHHLFQILIWSILYMFFVTFLDYIFLFLYMMIIHLLWRQEGVVMYCKLIPEWIELTPLFILLTL